MLLIVTPYLHNASFLSLETAAVFLSTLLFHYLMFGQNSLMDTSQGYDLKDPSKAHHPLVTGEISLTAAHNVIHWGIAFATLWAAILTLYISPRPALAMVFLIMWVVFGWGYNLGLSKESPVGFLSLTIGYTGMGAWSWLLSHDSFTATGLWYLVFVALVLVFQISWEGFVKDMELPERSNILKRMGAKLYHASIPVGLVWFDPGPAIYYGAMVKIANLVSLYPIILLNPKPYIWGWYWGMAGLAAFFAYKLLVPRLYDRDEELRNMSFEEIITIYLVVPVMLPWAQAIPLMVLGVLYFFLVNIVIWGKPFPRV